MAKEKAAASALAAALVLAAACQCQYPRAARSAALVLAARGSAPGRVVGGALLAAAEFAAAYDGSQYWNPPADTSSCPAVWNQPVATPPELIGTTQVFRMVVFRAGSVLRRC